MPSVVGGSLGGIDAVAIQFQRFPHRLICGNKPCILLIPDNPARFLGGRKLKKQQIQRRFTPSANTGTHTALSTASKANQGRRMKTWSIVAVEISMALAGIAMIGLMIVVSFL